MVFNVATVNFDDHVKNFAFLMDPAGRWQLAPAYDLTYAENDAWTRQHQMSVNGRFREHQADGSCSVWEGRSTSRPTEDASSSR